MYVLAKFAERYDADSYGQLIRRALGRKTAAGLSAVLLVYLWGSCVAYLVRQGEAAGPHWHIVTPHALSQTSTGWTGFVKADAAHC